MNRSLMIAGCCAVLTLSAFLTAQRRLFAARSLSNRPQPYLNMPSVGERPLPKLLSQTGAFQSVQTLKPSVGLVAYDVNVPLWSDGAAKQRWIALPQGATIHASPDGPWQFPDGTVFIKHFERPAGHRLETRILVRDAAGGVYGATYKWRADETDAELVDEPILQSESGAAAPQPWYFPGRADCRTCHTPVSGGVLGVSTRQLNRIATARGNNQLAEWADRGMLLQPPATQPATALARLDDESKSIADRARSYLDANCAHCHQPGGVAGNFDARFRTPLGQQNLVDGPVMINLGLDHAKVIAPADIWRSMVLVRMETHDRTRMPPLAHELVDEQAAKVMREWIASLPGKPVLPPPTIQTRGGDYPGFVRVAISAASNDGATIHYTLDGSLPLKSSPVYSGPVELHRPTTVRARVFAGGMTSSICVQETFIVNP